jgi:hypothetical protein
MEINKKQISLATKMFSLFLVCIFCLPLAGCKGDPNKISRLKKLLVNSEIYDASSVQIKVESYDKLDDGEIWMGEINGKNLYGAYTGYKEFIYIFYKNKGKGKLGIHVDIENYNMKDNESIARWEVASKPYSDCLKLATNLVLFPKGQKKPTTIAELEKIRDAKLKERGY